MERRIREKIEFIGFGASAISRNFNLTEGSYLEGNMKCISVVARKPTFRVCFKSIQLLNMLALKQTDWSTHKAVLH